MAPSRPCGRHVLPCLRAHARAVAPCRSFSTFALGHNTRIVLQDNSLCAHARSCRTHCAPCRALTGAVSWSCPRPYHGPSTLYRDPKSPPQPRYKICIATQLSSHAARAYAAARPCAQPALSWPVSWPYHAVSWVWPGRIVSSPLHVPARPCAASQPYLSQYNLLYYDSNLEKIRQ